MEEPSEGAYREHLRELRAWREDAARELRAFDKRVDELAEITARNSKRIASLARASEVADEVAKRLAARGRHRLEWWHVALGVIAILPAYVTMVVLLARLG